MDTEMLFEDKLDTAKCGLTEAEVPCRRVTSRC